MPLPEEIHADREYTDDNGKCHGSRIIEYVGHLKKVQLRSTQRLSISYLSVKACFVEKPIDLSILANTNEIDLDSLNRAVYNFWTHQIAGGRIADVKCWSIVFHREKSPEENKYTENGRNDQQGIVPAKPSKVES